MQNINGTIGFLLPASFKAKVKQAMEKGVGKVFGAITNNKVAGALAAKPDLFKDRNYNVYRRPGDRAIAAASAAGGPYRSSVEDFADPEAGFFDAASQNGSFMSAVEVSNSSHLLSKTPSLPPTSPMSLPLPPFNRFAAASAALGVLLCFLA